MLEEALTPHTARLAVEPRRFAFGALRGIA
jgi:hypothetical protein